MIYNDNNNNNNNNNNKRLVSAIYYGCGEGSRIVDAFIYTVIVIILCVCLCVLPLDFRDYNILLFR